MLNFTLKENPYFLNTLSSLGLDPSKSAHRDFIDFYSTHDVLEFSKACSTQLSFSESFPSLDELYHASDAAQFTSLYSVAWSVEDHGMLFFGGDALGNVIMFNIEDGSIWYLNNYENCAPEKVAESFQELLERLTFDKKESQ